MHLLALWLLYTVLGTFAIRVPLRARASAHAHTALVILGWIGQLGFALGAWTWMGAQAVLCFLLDRDTIIAATACTLVVWLHYSRTLIRLRSPAAPRPNLRRNKPTRFDFRPVDDGKEL